MRFAKTTEYGIRVMIYIGKHRQTWHSVHALHRRLDIPYKYLARLMRDLTRAGLLEVLHGKDGGYRLKGALSEIYLYQVVGVIEGLDNLERCILGFEECNENEPCPLHEAWLPFRKGIKELLYNTTLQELQKDGQRI